MFGLFRKRVVAAEPTILLAMAEVATKVSADEPVGSSAELSTEATVRVPYVPMTRQDFIFQPGPFLHEAIIGAFRAKGSSFEAWCRDNKVIVTSARQATFGQSRGPNGWDILARMIDAAGVSFVRHVYEKQLLEHADEVRRRLG
ncbi:hypothetical protein [Pseudorhodobacter sp.]|uniref:hypothetical protein n=1 Tax=Pseudorhodobacter sp. TaxID=1934400 RepID=UPI0026478B23|nr:hypothetical protein [Pseudorhodobacter sp.]MDN5785711.1 hypothetical protein [Pseudorhodobacter sp.]